MGTGYNHEIGYETLRKDFKRYQKETPRGVSLQNKRNKTIVLKFKIDGKEKSKGCNCSFSLDGMVEALRKAKLVATKLETLTSEVEFWEWYDKEIKNESQLVDDRITFEEAIKKVRDDFWGRPSRTKRKRSEANPSDLSSWYRTYGCFYKHLPEYKKVNLADIMKVIDMQQKGTRNYKYAVSAMKRLVRVVKRQDILGELDGLNVVQTELTGLQAITLDEFLKWRLEALGVTKTLDKKVSIESRKAWMWVFSMQVIYGLRLSEAFAIKNTHIDYTTLDGKIIPALNDPDNTDNLIYIGEKTLLGTTVKTGSRIARPQVPPTHPNLLEILEVKKPLVPTNTPTSTNPLRTNKFYTRMARQRLISWGAPTTQTHALRHLANINGIQAGIPQEVRAQSLGHTVQMNESVYKKRQGTQTTIDLLLNSNQNAIDFVTALAEAKKLVKDNESDKPVIAKLLSIIYQKKQDEIIELLP